MAKTIHRLSAVQIQHLKAGTRTSDGGNLYCDVKPDGVRRYWVYRLYRGGCGRVQWKSLGPVSKLSLSAARTLTKRYNDQLALGEDPFAVKVRVPTLREVAHEYMMTVLTTKNVRMRRAWRRAVEVYAVTLLDRPIDAITTEDALRVLRPIWTTKFETASRVRGKLAKLMTYAKGRAWRAGENPFAWTDNLSELLPHVTRRVTHFASMPYSEVPAFISDLKKRSGLSPLALQMLIATTLRSKECLSLHWSDVDWDRKVLEIPAARMKGGKVGHAVPLSTWALEILEELAMTRTSEFVFPGLAAEKHLNQMSTYQLVRPLGYTQHGFRSSFRTWVNEETTVAPHIAELSLAHQVGTQVERSYQRGTGLAQRAVLMQRWADFCLGQGAEIVELASRRTG